MFLYIVGCTKFYEIMIKLTGFEASLYDLKKKKDALIKGQKKITLVEKEFCTLMLLYFSAHVSQTAFN